MRKILTISALFLTLFSTDAFAQRVQRESGTYDYVIPEDESLVEARQRAESLCRIKILAETFGTSISSTEISQISGGEDRYSHIAESQVNGEWIRTVGEPVYTKSIRNDHFVLTVSMTGEVRKVERAQVDLRAVLLRNGTNLNHASSEFKSGDLFYLAFRTPKDGYLLIYMTDADQAMCLLPYPSQKEGAVKVHSKRDYIFFSGDYKYEEAEYPQPYQAVTAQEIEQDKIYVIFSPNDFDQPNAERQDIIETLPFREFQKWLSRVRQQDKKMVVKELDMIIRK